MTAQRIHDLTARMKLCALNTGAWRATRLHRDESAKVNADHGQTDTAKVHVKLTSSPALHELNKLHAAAYDAHKRLTLPTVQDGLRLLPVGREFEHSDTLRDFGAKHAALKAQFLAEYADEARTAPVRLNGLYDARHWPHVATIGEKFKFATRYLSCPTDGGWGDWISESARAAEDELRERLTEALKRVQERCAAVGKGKDGAEKAGKLYQTVFANLADVCALVPDMNFNDAAELSLAANSAVELGKIDAESISDNKAARIDAASKAAAILKAMGAQ